MKKNRDKQIVQWALAVLAGILIANTLCFFYERPAGWLDTPKGAATSVWRPGTVMVHGQEGFSVTVPDGNGFINPPGVLADRYVLVMGASHTQGLEVRAQYRYAELINRYFSDGSGTLAAYNIGCQGDFLPTQIKHFQAAVEAFPNASAITIEISGSDFTAQEIHEAMEQEHYDPEDSAMGFRTGGLAVKLKTAIKESMPLLSLLKKNIHTLRAQAAEENEGPYDYETELDAALSLIRSEFDGPIAFVYHPTTEIQPDGSLKLGYSDTWDIFRGVCEKNGIDVIDTGARFARLYETEGQLPYGFANTTPGSGHLNAQGHKILAEEIISYLEELRS